MRPGGGRQKGSNFERQLAKVFSDWCGYKINRTPLSGGWGNKREHGTCGDLVVERKYYDKFPFCVEAKKQEGWTLDDLIHNEKTKVKAWWQQCRADAKHVGKIPLLVMARNFVPPVIMMRQKDYSPEGLWTPLSDSFTFYMTTKKRSDEMLIMRLDDLLTSWPAPKLKHIKRPKAPQFPQRRS
jgi:Holliday junction resolvase